MHPSCSGPSSSSSGGIPGVAVVAVSRQELGEQAADNRPQEGKTGADDGHIALRSGPVRGAHVAV